MLFSEQIVRAIVCFLLLSTLFSLQAQAQEPWYQVEGIAGIKPTGRCIETMSATEVMEGVRLGIARIGQSSEKAALQPCFWAHLSMPRGSKPLPRLTCLDR